MVKTVKSTYESFIIHPFAASYLPELPLPELLPEDQLLPRELGGRDVLPGERVDGEGGDGVHVAAGDSLQPHDVCLSVVRRAAVEALVRRALGDVGLGVASSARWWRGEDEVISCPLIISIKDNVLVQLTH